MHAARQMLMRFMAALLISTAIVAMPCEPASAGTGDNYPTVWKNQPLGATLDTWRMATRYCTSWAAWALHDRNAFELPIHGDATAWGSNASALGYAVNMTPAKGAIAWWANGSLGHVAYVESVSSGGQTVTISEYNNPAGSGAYNLRTIKSTSVSGYIHFMDIAEETAAVTTASTAKSRVLFQRGDDALFALDTLDTGFVQETGSYWLRTDGSGTIASGGADGTTRLWINSCGAVYAKQGDLGPEGWTEEAVCGTAKSVAISNTGLQMLLTTCGSIYAKFGVGVGGWHLQQDCGDYTAIAVGANTQMLLTGCGAVYAKDSGDNLDYAGWTEEAVCGTAKSVAISNTGLQMMLTISGKVFAKYGISADGWQIQQEAGAYAAIAVGGNTQMLLTSCGSVYAKDNNLSYAGWTEEAACGTATAIAIGNLGRQVIIVSDASVFAKDSVGVGGWRIQVGPGNAKAIAVS